MSITLIIGPMWSGKSSELFRRLKRAEIADQKTVLYKYINDTRYDSDCTIASSHDGIKHPGVPVSDFSDEAIPDVDVIGIDEGQFIKGLAQFAVWAANAGKLVIIAGLDADYQMKPFPEIVNLVPLSERILKLHAVCFTCKQDASFTRRLDCAESALEVIGGADKYVSQCRKCYNNTD